MRRALGIPNRDYTGDVTSLPINTPLTFVRQLHKAKRAGKHEDFRFGDTGGLYSFAIRKGLPEEEGVPHLAVTQPLHAYSYKDFEGTIGKGYGSGTVSKIDSGELVLLSKSSNKLVFTRGDKRNAPIYVMVKTPNGNWLTIRKTEDAPPSISQYTKQHFKNVPLSQVAEILDNGAVASPKIDGAGALARVNKHGLDVYGIRKDKDGSLIRYTDHIGNLRDISVPKELRNTVYRTEVFGESPKGIIPPQELSGILNSTLSNAISKKKLSNIKLKLALLGKVTDKGEIYEDLTSDAKKLNLDSVIGLPTYNKDKAIEALEQMRKGSHPLTKEGLVLRGGNLTIPAKAKLVNDKDVVIRNIFKAITKGDNRAGGFEYSLPDSDKIVGRVGTGFDHSTLRDMLNKPDKYIGRVAKIKTQGQYDSGAYRAPSFISLHEDYA